MSTTKNSILLAIVTSGLFQVAEAAVLNNRLDGALRGASGLNHTKHEILNTQRFGSRVGMRHEELLFTRGSKWRQIHKRTDHKSDHLYSRMANGMEVIHKTAYWGTVKMGEPAQEFRVIFDTGSGNLIIPSKKCESAGCAPHRKFDPTLSTTAFAVVNERGESSTEISFGTGDISGDYYQDRFCIAENLCTDVRFVASTVQSTSPFSTTPFDGILGLGFQDLSMGDNFNILDSLNKAGQLPNGLFSFFLTDDLNSEITFGGFKADQVASDIVWANVVRQSYWQVGIDDITFNDEVTGLCPGGCQVAVDTGTSMLAGPSVLVKELQKKLGAKDDCSNFDKLPRIGFKVGNKVLNMAPEDYMDNAGGDCSFSVMDLDVPPPKGPLFIFGDPFLRRFVTIYDKKGPRVGFAVAKHGNMDAAQAGKIISDVGGKAPSAKLAKEPTMSANPIVLTLESGMMTSPGGAEPVDHDISQDALSQTSSKQDTKIKDGDDFTATVDKWLAGTQAAAQQDRDAPVQSEKIALLQGEGLALRGHRTPEVSKLLSVRLTRSEHVF